MIYISYYSEWKKVIESKSDDSKFVKSFLCSSKESNDVWLVGSIEDLIEASRTLLSISVEHILSNISGEYDFTSGDIVQYSSFENGTRKTCRVLEYDIKLAGFAELGELLNHSETEYAKKKYGENHSKLAAEFSLVRIDGIKSRHICNTAFGSFSIALENCEFYELLRRLGLRNAFIKALISAAKLGVIYYDDLASRVLKSKETKIRRKSNVKEMMGFCLGKNSRLLSNIIWS